MSGWYVSANTSDFWVGYAAELRQGFYMNPVLSFDVWMWTGVDV